MFLSKLWDFLKYSVHHITPSLMGNMSLYLFLLSRLFIYVVNVMLLIHCSVILNADRDPGREHCVQLCAFWNKSRVAATNRLCLRKSQKKKKVNECWQAVLCTMLLKIYIIEFTRLISLSITSCFFFFFAKWMAYGRKKDSSSIDI